MGRYRGLFALLGFLFSFVAQAPQALAYTQTVTPAGAPVRWPSDFKTGGVRLDLAGNAVNASGLSSAEVFTAVTHALQRWKTASGGSVDFDYWQGTDPSIYIPASSYDGLSSLYFASNAARNSSLSSNVLGLTQVWYDTNTGRILETDVALNDRDFRFTMNPSDTSGYGSGAPTYSGGRPNVFIENVVTHELGHAFGLSHSGGLQSTMLFMESPEQAHLGCDEQVAIHSMYPSADAGLRGTISGTVVSDSGVPIFGAHVVAISRRRGTVLATALTDKSGRYALSGLEQGAYFLMVEPFYAGAQTLPSYYAQVTGSVCGTGRLFGRTMLSNGMNLVAVSVDGGGQTEAPLFTAHCTSDGGAAVGATTTTSNAGTAPVIFDGTYQGGGFGAADRFSYSNSNYYRLNALSGHVEIHVMSYSLYSPVRPTVTLLDSSGSAVAVTTLSPEYQGDSGFVNYDSTLIADALPAGNYAVKVTASYLDSSLYPAGPISLDSVPFLLVTGSVNESAPALAGTLSANARCRMAENFPAYSSPAGDPPRANSQGGGVGFCGTVERLGKIPGDRGPDRRPGGHSGPGAAAAIGWLLPFLSIALIARLVRRIPDSTG